MKGTQYTLYNKLIVPGLRQMICEVTRPQSKLCLDHVYVNTNVLTSSVASTVSRITVHGSNCIVKSAQVHELLRLYVDSHLTWNAHVTKLCAKLRSRLYVFSQVKRLMPLRLRARTLYFTRMVQPLIDYGCISVSYFRMAANGDLRSADSMNDFWPYVSFTRFAIYIAMWFHNSSISTLT